MKLADMEDYIRVVYGLLADDTVETEFEGKQRKIRFLNPEFGVIKTDPDLPLHVSAYGPRSRRLTAKLGAGWLNFIGDVDYGTKTLAGMQEAWQTAGRSAAELSATVFVLGCVLEDGEPYDSDRAMAQAGPRAAVILHRAADEALAGLPNSSGIPPAAADAIEGYVELAKTFEPADARYLMNHRGHLMFVKPEERQFVTGGTHPRHQLHRDRPGTQTTHWRSARRRIHGVHGSNRAWPGGLHQRLGRADQGIHVTLAQAQTVM